MDNVNKTNADRLRGAEDTVTGMKVQGPAIAAIVKTFIFEGSTARKLSVEELVELLAERLATSNEQFRQADAAHQAETSGDVDARDAREAAIATLRETVVAASHAVTGAFGPSMRASMGLDVVWALRGDLLVGQVRNAVQLIRKTRKLQPLAAGVKVDAGELADALEVECGKLEVALETVKREERAAQATYQERELAARDWERFYPGIAEIFTGLCILAGRDELAARVKPTVRKTRSRGSKDPSLSVAAETSTSTGNVAAPNGAHTPDVITH